MQLQTSTTWLKFSNWFTHKWKWIHFNDKFILSMLHTFCRWWLWTNSPSFLHAFSWRQGVCYSFHLTSYWEKRNDEIIFTSLFTSNTSFQLFQSTQNLIQIIQWCQQPSCTAVVQCFSFDDTLKPPSQTFFWVITQSLLSNTGEKCLYWRLVTLLIQWFYFWKLST